MARKKKGFSPLEEKLQAVAHHYLERMQKGEKITITTILEELLTALMTAERDLFLQTHRKPGKRLLQQNPEPNLGSIEY